MEKNIKVTDVTSRSNPLIVMAASLSEKKYRSEYGKFAFEGYKLFSDAISSGIVPETVIVTEKAFDGVIRLLPDTAAVEIVRVSDSVYAKITSEKSPEGIFCIAKHLDNLHKSVTIYNDIEDKTVFIACCIRDPGNVGTLIRTANAFGTDVLLLSSDCADIYNPKTVRGSMGAIFRQKIAVCDDTVSSIRSLRDAGYTVYAAALHKEAKLLGDINVDDRVCFVVGNEGNGLPSDVIEACDGCALIPMMPESESLNVSAAGAVFMWECAKNRLLKKNGI